MPVVWNTASCNPPTPKDDTDGHWRSAIIDISGPIGLSKVTEDNVEEWLWRVEFLRYINGDRKIGCLIYADKRADGGYRLEPLTPAVLRRWVGLWTNWSNYTRASFVKNYVADLEARVTGDVQSELKEDALVAAATAVVDAKPKRKRRRVKA